MRFIINLLKMPCCMLLSAASPAAISGDKAVSTFADTQGQKAQWYIQMSPIQNPTINAKGELVIWHNRTGRELFASKEECQDELRAMQSKQPAHPNMAASCKKALTVPVPVRIINDIDLNGSKDAR